VLGPDADSFHRNHFHLDLRAMAVTAWGASANCELSALLTYPRAMADLT
jgi:Extensin-like protein C-terminus